MVKYWSLAQQLAVESYFRTSAALTPLYYWVGVSRTSKTGEYKSTLDGGRLPQVRGLDAACMAASVSGPPLTGLLVVHGSTVPARRQ